MGIDKLNSAAWAAGFAMAPTEDDAFDAMAPDAREDKGAEQQAGWRSATASAPSATPEVKPSAMRQWLAGLQRRATA